ncbi:predicted protein [Nematostella vectensis]|uniref:Uncharacterized protein n=1 Tax=Nematostella vectensis TaxID=45351 RepID=A7S4T8_NEMVE|nr:predicted protein [Nematostella vectensis]|eukprot:XP_001633317.1 predicted protein [Nematostella vectensis]
MEDMPIDSLQHVTQIVSLVNLATGQKEELSLITQEKSLDMLTRAMDYMRSRMGNDTLTELEQNIANSFLTSMSNLLTVLSDGALMFAKGPKYSIQQLRKSKELTKKAVLQLRKLGNSILRTKVLDEDPSVYSSRSISLILSKNSPSSLEGMSGRALKTSNNEVNFPALGGVMEMQNISRTDTLQSKAGFSLSRVFTKPGFHYAGFSIGRGLLSRVFTKPSFH